MKVDNLFEFEAQSSVLEPVEVEPYVPKVDLGGFEVYLVGQQDIPAGCWVVLVPPKVAVEERVV